MKRVILTMAKDFVFKERVQTTNVNVEPEKEVSFFDWVKFVKCFCYLGDRLNASGVSEAAVTARTSIEWMKFRKCGELLYKGKFSL